MRQEVQLFLRGQEVEFSEPPEINFVYQRVDYTNPTVIKNSYTKTLTIEGTPENNQIFNSIYNLERTQSGEGTYFNPSKRVPFELFENGDILEQGYAKLDKVLRSGHKIEYQLTLYGGLGDFFYGLSYCESSEGDTNGGRELTLGDLTFKSEDDDSDISLDFDITRANVYDAWNNLGSNSWIKNKWDIINFAPAYNGIPEGLDADKVLIDATDTSNIKMRQVDGVKTTEENGFPTENGDYGLWKGYALAELNEEMNEWQMRDLRSWCQRPIMSVKGLFNGIQNATKYKLDLDSSFFRWDNPYWEEAWFTLPMLSELDNTSEDKTATPSISSTYEAKSTDYRFRLDTDTHLYEGVSSVKVTFRPSVTYKGSSDATARTADKLYPAFHPGSLWHRKYGGLACQLIGYDGSGNAVAGSDIIWCTNYAQHGGSDKAIDLKDTNFDSLYQATTIPDYGYFQRASGSTNESVPLYWNKSLTLELDTTKTNITYVGLRICFANDAQNKWLGTLGTASGNTSSYLYGDKLIAIDANISSGSMTITTPDDIMSGARITKKKLLSSVEGTPCDFLLSYCKLFNLYFEKDIYSDIIYIRHRAKFYDGTVVDIDKQIDHTKDIEINPIAFSAKFYNFNYSTDEEPELAESYTNEYGNIFGQQKVDTGYNFDASSEDLLEGNVFQNGLQVQETSKYYTFITTQFNDDHGLPPFFYNGSFSYNLYSTAMENKETMLFMPTTYLQHPISDIGEYYDAVNKLQLHSNDDEPIDGSCVLCFYTGNRYTPRLQGYDSSGNPVYDDVCYRLTDDVQAMIDLNGKPTWLYTNDDTKSFKITYLPQFSRYCDMQGNVMQDGLGTQIGMTWDFGATACYIPNYRYSSLSTIYNRFWKGYISDLYNVNTRIVTAYVRLKGKVLGDLLKHFYYFDNSIWVLTKITDYNITSFETVKCEFAKVMDKTDYTKALNFNPVVTVTLDDDTPVPAEGGTVTATVYCSDGGSWYVESELDVSPSSYGGGSDTKQITITVPANTGEAREFYVAVCAEPSWGHAYIQQEAYEEYSIVISPSQGSVDAKGGYNLCYVVCDGSWTLSSNRSYVTFKIQGSTASAKATLRGKGNAYVYVYFSANTSSASRIAQITGVCGNNTCTASLTQSGVTYWYLALNRNNCVGCGNCSGMLLSCPVGLAITFDDDGIANIANITSCTACGACDYGEDICPQFGTALQKSTSPWVKDLKTISTISKYEPAVLEEGAIGTVVDDDTIEESTVDSSGTVIAKKQLAVDTEEEE